MNKDFKIYIEGFFTVEEVDYFSKIVKGADHMGIKIEKICLKDEICTFSFSPIILEGSNEN